VGRWADWAVLGAWAAGLGTGAVPGLLPTTPPPHTSTPTSPRWRCTLGPPLPGPWTGPRTSSPPPWTFALPRTMRQAQCSGCFMVQVGRWSGQTWVAWVPQTGQLGPSPPLPLNMGLPLGAFLVRLGGQVQAVQVGRWALPACLQAGASQVQCLFHLPRWVQVPSRCRQVLVVPGWRWAGAPSTPPSAGGLFWWNRWAL